MNSEIIFAENFELINKLFLYNNNFYLSYNVFI